MNSSSLEDIKETVFSVPRPIKIPSAVVGFIADLIIAKAKKKVSDSRSNPSDT